jgi:hypothetical protein
MVGAQVERFEPLERRSPQLDERVCLDRGWRLAPQVRVVRFDHVREAAAARRPVLEIKGSGEAQHDVDNRGPIAQGVE